MAPNPIATHPSRLISFPLYYYYTLHVMNSMVRDRKEQMVIQSSIVLLQERFRQLQKARELRAERELLNPKPNHQDKNISQYYREPSSQQLLSLSLCPHSTSDFIEKPSFYHHWPKKDENKVVGIDRYDDVDTSLRL
ncbi:hypothetical protein HID58_003991 [Brassica napus]|uniref:Uncharacterized protein n=1 Tax=Brassica napus TaxID=3708 RepID=A0ABQ7XIF2_BRANA|nr:hypothetical protein HID58_003991 [Brassica napus]